jgi:amino acid permease
LGVFFDIAIAVKCFGVAVSYLIIIGDLMPQVKEIREGKKWILTPPFIGTFIFF